MSVPWLYGRDDFRGRFLLDVDDLRLLRPRRCCGGDELVASVPKAPAPTVVTGRDDEQCDTDDDTNGDANDCTDVGFTTIITTAYLFVSHTM